MNETKFQEIHDEMSAKFKNPMEYTQWLSTTLVAMCVSANMSKEFFKALTETMLISFDNASKYLKEVQDKQNVATKTDKA